MVDFEFDRKICCISVSTAARKMPVTICWKALGYNNEQIFDIFYDKETFYLSSNGVQTDLVVGRLKGEMPRSISLDKEGNVLVAKGKRITAKISVIYYQCRPVPFGCRTRKPARQSIGCRPD